MEFFFEVDHCVVLFTIDVRPETYSYQYDAEFTSLRVNAKVSFRDSL